MSVSYIKRVAWKLNGQFTVIKVRHSTPKITVKHYNDFYLKETCQSKIEVCRAQKYAFVYYSKHEDSVHKRNTSSSLHMNWPILIIVHLPLWRNTASLLGLIRLLQCSFSTYHHCKVLLSATLATTHESTPSNIATEQVSYGVKLGPASMQTQKRYRKTRL